MWNPMQPWKASEGRPPKLTEEERRRRDRERKRATASSRWLAPPAAIPSTCKQRNPIKNPMELLEELPADLVLYIAEFLPQSDLEAAAAGLKRHAPGCAATLIGAALRRREERLQAWLLERDALGKAYAQEAAGLPHRYPASSPTLACCTALARDLADVRISCAVQTVALELSKERSRSAEWPPPRAPHPEERCVLEEFRSHVLRVADHDGKQRLKVPNLDTRAMRGEVATLARLWDPMTSALSAGTAVEKRHADVSLRILGKALGVKGY